MHIVGIVFRQQINRWEEEVYEVFVYLGFLINTQDMTVTWPQTKREALHNSLPTLLGLFALEGAPWEPF